MSETQSTSTDISMTDLNEVAEVCALDKQSIETCMSDCPTTMSQELHGKEGKNVGSSNDLGAEGNKCKGTNSNVTLSTEQLASMYVELVHKKDKRSPKGKNVKQARKAVQVKLMMWK